MSIGIISIYNAETVKSRYTGHFFDNDTMSFFGDTMDSFRCCCIEDVEYMYRRPDTTVNVFGTRKIVGKEFFNCWEITKTENNGLDLDSCDSELTEKIYYAI